MHVGNEWCGLLSQEEVTSWSQSQHGRGAVHEISRHMERKSGSQVTVYGKRERVKDAVCSIVHNVVSRDVTSKIHTRKSQSFLCDTLYVTQLLSYIKITFFANISKSILWNICYTCLFVSFSGFS